MTNSNTRTNEELVDKLIIDGFEALSVSHFRLAYVLERDLELRQLRAEVLKRMADNAALKEELAQLKSAKTAASP